MRYQQRAAPPPSDEPLEFVLSDGTVDRMGDVIEQDGWQLANFRKHPIALFNHDRDQIIGRWTNVGVRNNKLMGTLALAEAGTSALVDTIRSLLAQGILRAVSVGFRSLKKEKLTEDASEFFGPFRFLRTELLEASLVAVPANPNALEVAKDFPREIVAEIFSKPANESHDDASVRSAGTGSKSANGHVPARGKPAKPLVRTGTMMKTNSQKIQEAQQKLVSLRDKLTELNAKETLSVEETEVQDQLPDEIESTKAEIARLQKIERALAPDPDTVRNDNPDTPLNGEVLSPEQRRPFAVPKKKIEPIDFLVRTNAVLVKAHIMKQPIMSVLESNYGTDGGTGIILRAATAPATTTAVGWAAELVETINGAFLDILRPVSIYTQLANRGARFTFGRAGGIRVPARSPTPTLAGSFVGEGQPKPVRKLTFVSTLLSPHKMAVISLFTEELAEHSNPSIEQIIRDAMRDDTAAAIDAHLIDNVAASAIRPAGLLNGVTPLTASAATDPTQAMLADLRALMGAIIANNGGRDIVFLMNSAQGMGVNFAMTPSGLLFSGTSEAGERLGASIMISNTVPAGTVIAIDAADFASATGDVPRYSVSNEATVHMEDTTPLPITTGAQGSAVAATPVTSLWQTDCIGVRMHWPLSWAMRRAGMIAVVEDVVW